MKLQFVFFLFCVIAFCASLSFVALSGPSIGIAAPATFPASGWGDFNRDGYLDLAACGNANSGIYLNNRNETFTVIPGVTLFSSGNCFVSVGDINNDNWPDIVYNNGPAVILINNQNNTFTTLSGPLTGNNQHRLIDVNNDGKQDFMAFRPAGTSGVFRNNGNNTFTLGFAFFTSSSDSIGDILDVNGDGLFDIIYAYVPSVALPVSVFYVGNGQFNFTSTSTNFIPSIKTNAVAGDFNNDNLMDIASTISAVPGISISLNINKTSIFQITSFGSGNNGFYCINGDFDNNGLLDVFHNKGTGNSGFELQNPMGTFTFGAFNATDGSGSLSPDAADFNNDGRLDAIIETNAPSLTILKNVGTPVNAPPSPPSSLFSLAYAPGSYNLSWSHSSSLVSFNVYVNTQICGTGQFVVSPIANIATGKSYVSKLLGNAGKNKFFLITGLNSAQTYYWSVQARDMTYQDGLFAAEGCFGSACWVVPSSSSSSTSTSTTGNTNLISAANQLQWYF